MWSAANKCSQDTVAAKPFDPEGERRRGQPHGKHEEEKDKGAQDLRLVFSRPAHRGIERRKKSISQTINDMELPQKTFRKVVKEDDEEVFNDDEVVRLLDYLTSVPDILNLGIILMFCTGVHVGELVAIKWCDVTDNSIKIRRTEISYKNKNGENVCEIRNYPKTEAGVRTVFVPTEFSSIIGRLRLLSGNQEYVFWKDGQSISAMQIRKRMYFICKKAGIRKKSPHKLRKTYVSILLDNGVDKRLVQDVAGHAQISTSERNYHRNRKSDQRKEEILSDIPEFRNAKLMF